MLTPDEFTDKLRSWISSMFVAARDGGVVAFLISEEWADHVGIIMSRHGPRLNRVIWRETFANYASSEQSLTNEHRHLFIHRKRPGRSTFNNDISVRVMSDRQMIGDARANKSGRMPGDVWTAPRLTGNHSWRVDWHAAQLHPAPLTRLVRIYTNPNDVVCDAFAGSGNLGVVCALEGRRFVGIEKDAGTAKRICDRVWGAYGDPSSIPAVDMSVMGELVES
jgi:DNA modification methylase